MKPILFITIFLIAITISSCCTKSECANNPPPIITILAGWPIQDTVFIFEFNNNVKVNEEYLIHPKTTFSFNGKFQYQVALINRDSVKYEIENIKNEFVNCGGDCFFSKSENKVPSFVSMSVNGKINNNGRIEIK
jgi:hypothetical protein